MEGEVLDMDRYHNLGIVKSSLHYDGLILNNFLDEIKNMRDLKKWNKWELVDLFSKLIPSFEHKETGKYLDAKM
jgi:hypothetical protein